MDNRDMVLTTIFVLLMLLIFVPHDSRASESGSKDLSRQNIIDRK
jgi:hypothetical protein